MMPWLLLKLKQVYSPLFWLGTLFPPRRLSLMPFIFAVSACAAGDKEKQFSLSPSLKSIDYQLVDTAEQNSRYFVQGLELDKGYFYVSSGGYGRSALIKEPAKSNHKYRPERKIVSLPYEMFAEGLTVAETKLFVLTWRARKGFVYDLDLNKKAEFSYPHEGWGIAYVPPSDEAEASLLVSDGSATIRRYNANSLKEVDRFSVSQAGKSFRLLNELEYVDGFLFANRFGSSQIIIIDITRQKAVGLINASSIVRKHAKLRAQNADAVLNGIAYDKANKALWITGKLWPRRYLIKPKLATPNKAFQTD